MNAEHGIVSTHAQTIRPATPQRTADALVTEPTPTIAPVMVCVVETGTPRLVPRKRGESKIDPRILVRPAVSSTLAPDFATAAPARPPMRACDELDGMPNHHVIKSHAMARVRAAKTTAVSMTLGSTTPLPMVFATC